MDAETQATHFYELRNNSWIALIHPELEVPATFGLDAAGVYICCPIAGDFHFKNSDTNGLLNTRQLHLVRNGNAGSGRFTMCSRCALGFLAYVSPEWCYACPQGPACPIAQFLLKGKGAGNGLDKCGYQAINADDAVLEISDKILTQRFPSDTNQIELETSLFCLLSWAFTRGALVKMPDNGISRPHLRNSVKIRQAAEILRQNLDQPPTVVELGRRVGMNSSDLKRGFKQLYGSSPAKYSREFRMETARDLLTGSSLSIARIALDMGFLNPSQFSRAFRQQFGVNPSDIRRNAH